MGDDLRSGALWWMGVLRLVEVHTSIGVTRRYLPTELCSKTAEEGWKEHTQRRDKLIGELRTI